MGRVYASELGLKRPPPQRSELIQCAEYVHCGLSCGKHNFSPNILAYFKFFIGPYKANLIYVLPQAHDAMAILIRDTQSLVCFQS